MQGNTRKVNFFTKEYESSRQIITVTGFVPASEPKFAVTLIIDEPHQNIDKANYLVVEDYNRIIKAVLGKYS